MKNSSIYKNRRPDNQNIKRGGGALSNPSSATKKPVTNNISSSCGFFHNNSRDSSGTAVLEVETASADTSSKKKMLQLKKSNYNQNVRVYTPARLTRGKEWYVSFYAFDPAHGEMRRKRIKLNRIKDKKVRKEYALDLLSRLNSELINGWNPWINLTSENSYTTFDDGVSAYRRYIDKLYHEEFIREKTWKGYYSMSKILMDFNNASRNSKRYIYQFNVDFCNKFIDWIWLEQGLSGTTRDNYIVWLRTFAKWLVGQEYIESDPTVGLTMLGKKKGKKTRSVIKQEDMTKLKDYCETHNKWFLLACYIIYYCFVRPKEMSHIQISHISVNRGTLFIPDYSSKNKKDGVVTLPDKVIKLMLELNIFSNPDSYYLFGNALKPAKERQSDKQFRDFWSNYVRKALNFPKSYKFYSLKDTGITDLIRSNKDLISVRDQARHSTLLMTDIYTPKDIEEANELLRHHSSIF